MSPRGGRPDGGERQRSGGEELGRGEQRGGEQRSGGRLSEYRRKRDAARTPEPVPAEHDSVNAKPVPAESDSEAGAGNRFVIQEHHATSLHWDLRLERDGVLASWAVPRGLPPTTETNHLAVHTEDHPLEYADFSGEIPQGEYGGGSMTIWDRGTYLCEKWNDREVKFVLDGERAQGRFVLFQTDGKNWMIHRMDRPVRPDWQPLPAGMRPMPAAPGRMPPAGSADDWSYEFEWPGFRSLVAVDGGRVRATSAEGADITSALPELRSLGEHLGLTQVLLDGTLVAFDPTGQPDPIRMRGRIGVRGAEARGLSRRTPAVLLISDLLHLDGTSLLNEPYWRRRELLAELGLDGPAWKVSPSFAGGGAAVRAAAREQHFERLLAKRPASPYRAGTESPDWRSIRA